MALTITYNLTNNPSGFLTNEVFTIGDQLAPDVLGLSNGGFVAAYHDSTPIIDLDFYDAGFKDVEAQLSIDGGQSTSAVGQPSLTQLANGNVLVVWDDDDTSDGNAGLRGHLFSPTGAIIGSDLTLGTTANNRALNDPQVAALAGGGFVISFTFNGDILYGKYNDAGTLLNFGFHPVNTVATAGPQDDSAVAALADGGFVVTYTDANGLVANDIRGTIYNADGTVRHADFSIGSQNGDQTQSKVVGLPNGNFAVVYTDSNYANEGVNSNGITLVIFGPFGGFESIVAGAHVNTGSPTVSESDPDVTVLPNGFIVVTWTRPFPSNPADHDIYARVFDQSGTPVSFNGYDGEFPITNKSTDEILSAISHLVGGKFITTWQDSQSDGSGGQITSTVSEVTRTVTGDAGNDTFTGDQLRDSVNAGAGNDTIRGNGGDDAIDGGPGIDTAVFSGLRAAYTIHHLTNAIQVSGPDGVDTLTNIEQLAFDDAIIALKSHRISDFNGDGKTDLLVLNDTLHGAATWLMDGTQIMSNSQVGAINAAGGWRYADTGDFNGDHKSDLLLLNDTTHGAAIWQMNGAQVELDAEVGTINAAAGWRYADLGDFNGDGKTDLLLLNDTNHGVAIWQMDGTQVISNSQAGTINAAGGWRYTGTGDFNGDHKSDLLLLNDATHGVAIWQMNGPQVELDAQVGAINAAAGWRYADFGDFNGDGKTDLLLLNDTNHGVAIWQMDGTQVMSNSQVGTINTGAGWRYADTGDFNGDHKTDLLLLNDMTHGVSIWQMDGTQVVASPQVGTINAAAGWHYDGVRDFNGDGKSDLLLETDTTHAVSIWQMNGTQVGPSPVVGAINAAADWHFLL